MVDITICEDHAFFRECLLSEIKKYVMVKQYDFQVVLATANPQEVLRELATSAKRGVYFLDVDLQNEHYDGFSLGQEIRKRDPRGFIIYVTTHDELAFETFKYRLEALDYVIKDELFGFVTQIQQCLDSIVERIAAELTDDRRYYTLKMYDEIHQIAIDEIILIETASQQHRLVLHTKNQALEFFGSLSEVAEELGEGFMRVHRSFFIQLNKIEQVSLKENRVLLETGLACDVARTKKKALQTYLKKVNF